MGTPNGFGVTLKNLFGDWPRENIRFFYNREEYRLQPKSDLDFRFAPVPASPGRRYAIPKILGITPEWRGQYSQRWLKRNLSGFEPDLVFSSVHSIHSILFGDWTAQQLQKPHALHVMDEPFHDYAQNAVCEILGRTCSLMTISQTMRTAYKELYGVESEVFHNGAERAFFTVKTREQLDDPIRLRFIGNLLQLQHFNAIEDIAEAVLEFNKRSPRKAVFEIFGNEIPSGCSNEIIKEGEIIFHGPIPLEDRLTTIAQADILVIPFTFDPSIFESYRLSIPTKLPENLATGIPVLLYGPKGMAATDLCIDQGLGTVISERSVSHLVEFLHLFHDDQASHVAKAKECQKYIDTHLSAEAMSSRFQQHLLGLCKNAA